MRFASRRCLGVSLLAAAAAALVVLMLLPAAASGEYAPASLTNTAGAPVTLTVSIAGNGAGSVTTNPTGINCPTICSAQFPDGTSLTLYDDSAPNSRFGGWSAPPAYSATCPYLIALPTGPVAACYITVSAALGDVSIQAAFNLRPCTVPNVKGRTLAGAKLLMKYHRCKVGSVKHAFSHKVPKGRVISQSPPAGSQEEQGAKVNLVLSKGRR